MAKGMKIVGSTLVSATLLMGAGVGIVSPYEQAHAAESNDGAARAEQIVDSASTQSNQVLRVEGAFSFDQGIVSSSGVISGVFAKAASAVCAALPQYGALCSDPIRVESASGSFEATVDEMAADEGSQSCVLACSCSSNAAGGGAIANAEVSGVSFETVLQLAGVR